MNKKELEIAIKSLSEVRRYTLKGGYLEDGIVLNNNKVFRNLWDVYYCERGYKRYYAKSCSEDEACQIMYNLFLEHIEILNTRVHNISTKEHDEKCLFITCVATMVRITVIYKELPLNISAFYFEFRKNGNLVDLKISGSATYKYNENSFCWNEDFIPTDVGVHFTSDICNDKDAFIERIVSYMHYIVSIDNLAAFFKDKIIFIGYKGENPIMLNLN